MESAIPPHLRNRAHAPPARAGRLSAAISVVRGAPQARASSACRDGLFRPAVSRRRAVGCDATALAEIAARSPARMVPRIGTARTMSIRPVHATSSRSPIGTTSHASTPGLRRHARRWTGESARRDRHLHRGAASLGDAATRRCSPRSAGPKASPCIADGMSGEVQEHAYWGGMRDRIPLSQTERMAPGGTPRLDPRRRARAREAARQSLPDPLRSGLERHRGVRAQDVSRRRRAGAARRHGFPARRRARDRLLRQPLHDTCSTLTARRAKNPTAELVEKPRRAGALGGIASDPRENLRRGDEISVDARAVREAAALSRGHGGRAPTSSSSNIWTVIRTGMLAAVETVTA